MKRSISTYLDYLFRVLERCWPGVIGGLVAGFVATGFGGSLFGGIAAMAGAVGGTWLHLTRGKSMRALALPAILTNSVGALVVVGIVFTVYVLVSWTKWLLALAAVGVIAWFYLLG
jgi:hypothetical protein